MPPRISVVMIFFNSERYIAEAIDSVLAQTFTDFELLLVDDGSTNTGSAITRDWDRFPATVHYLEHGPRQPRHVRCAQFRLAKRRRRICSPSRLGRCLETEQAGRAASHYGATPRSRNGLRRCSLLGVVGRRRGPHRAIWPHPGSLNSSPEAMLRVYPVGTATAPCPSDLLMRRDLMMSLGGFEEQLRPASIV